mgnify:CR=1 FL=1
MSFAVDDWTDLDICEAFVSLNETSENGKAQAARDEFPVEGARDASEVTNRSPSCVKV